MAKEELISLRITPEQRAKLEQASKAMRPAHPDLSMSDVLRAIIGAYDPKSYSAEKERLYADPLSAMLEIRAAPQDGRTLTKEQWEMVISYAQTGAETARLSPLSRETYIGLLEGFRAVFQRAKASSNEYFGYYTGNLSLPGMTTPTRKEDVLQAVEDTVKFVRETTDRQFKPAFCVRNLEVVLQKEKFHPSEIDQALRPFWPIFWRVAARGYFATTGAPVRQQSEIKPQAQYLPSTEVEGVRLAALITQSNDLSLLLELPAPLGGVWYPLGSYPVISEFRRMLLHPIEGVPGNDFDGKHFYAFGRGNGPDMYHWRGSPHGITVAVTAEQWNQIRALFDAAFNRPELARVWSRLSDEYGEI